MKIIENSECQTAFGDYIKNARERKNLTQAEVAEQLGIGQSYYSIIENGTRNRDFVVALKICAILEVDIQTFIARYI